MNYIELKKRHEEEKKKFIARARENTDFIVDGEDVRLAGSFYEKQQRIALRNYRIIEADSLNDYIAREGYLALGKALFELEKEDILEELVKANLRGRGGAGFPCGLKVKGAYQQDSEEKYVICNADEGDPGAYMDRSILEGDPHSILEAMTIIAYTIGAQKGYVYVRAEYPIAVKMLQKAIDDAHAAGLLGENILHSGFSFDIEIRLGAGAFVCGEGTALIQSIEGNRGMPQAKVYRTTEKGLYGKPTVLNNVETLANIPRILLQGADWFLNIGTEDSPGTKVFALVGQVKNAGLVEVPMGMTLREIIYDIGGGATDGHQVKAVQTGGPSGGCIPPHLFDTKVDFASLTKIGSIMGSGGMVVMDDTDCMVDIAKFFMKFTVDESCGKCTPCRVGNKRVLESLERISSGHSRERELEDLKELCEIISDTSLCGLGKTATTPVLSSLKYFLEEYTAHIEEHQCAAGVCKDLLKYVILDNCIGCSLCKKSCPVSAISGESRQHHSIDTEVCIHCDACRQACPVKAIGLR